MSIPSNIQQHIFDLLNKTSNVSFVSAERLERSLGLTPGQIVTAEIKSLLPFNRAQVSIGTTLLNLELPLAVRVGQSIELTYVADDPRPTFAMPRPGETSPPVRLSDASRLLGMLLGTNQMSDPQVRASLASVSQLLHQAGGESNLLATVLDEALTYSPRNSTGAASLPGAPSPPLQEATARTSFENNAAQILQQIARNARFTMVEAVNQPLTPLPLLPGEEVNASVTGTLPGGRVFVQVAGTSLELALSTAVPQDGIIRLTYLSSFPKPLFALQRAVHELPPGSLSEAGRWLSVLEHSQGGVSNQQMNVLQRLNQVISSLPPDSPAFTAIRDEALTYDTLLRRPPNASEPSTAHVAHNQQSQSGNGIVLHDDMAKLLQALIKGNRLAILEAINQQVMPTGLQPGQQVRGDVLVALGGGRFMLDVAGKAMEFTLPKGIGVGNRLQLFFITSDPHPVFLLARFGGVGDSTVSQAGRWIGNLLETPQEDNSVSKTGGLLRTLLGEPPTDAGRVSQALEKNLKGSGLFYESHLTRWFGAEYPLEDILNEPQGKLSTLRQVMLLNQPSDMTDEAMQIVNGTSEQPMLQSLVRHGVASTGAENMADPRTLPIVHDQLTTLQNGHLLFRGELFPGQQMQWGIHERNSQRGEDGSTERSWETHLALELPRLGSIKAQVVLEKGGVTVQIQAEHEASTIMLDKGKLALKEQLEAAGLQAEAIWVRHEKT